MNSEAKGQKGKASKGQSIRRILNKLYDRAFSVVGLLATLVGLAVLLTLLIDVFMDGASRLGWQFLTSYPSRKPEQAGILSAWGGAVGGMGPAFYIGFHLGVV